MDVNKLRSFLSEAGQGPLGTRTSKNLLRFFSAADEYGPKGMGLADRGMQSSATGVAGGVAGALGGVGDKMLMTGNPLAMAGGAVAKFAAGIAEGAGKVREWGDALHENNRKLADYSGSMAAVMAQDDAKRIWLQRDQGERRASSAKELADARYRLDSSLAPIEDAFANLKNNVIAKLTGVLADFSVKLTKIFPWLEGPKKDDDKDFTGQGHLWLEGFTAEQKEIEKRRPERMR